MKIPYAATLSVLAITAGCGPAPASLLRTASLEAGDACTNGGVRVEGGVDANDDGVLQDDEVSSTADVCNGAPGSDGNNGAPGADGIDGAPGVFEVGPVIEGDYFVANSLDVQLLEGVREITGSLIFEQGPILYYGTATSVHSIVLPDLERVGGAVLVYTLADLETLELPALTTIGEILYVYVNPALTGLRVDALENLGSLYVWGNPQLATLGSLDALQTGSSVEIGNNDMLTATPTLRALQSSGSVSIYYNPRLSTFEGWDAITSVGSMNVGENASLACVDAATYARLEAAVTGLFGVSVGPCAR